MMLPKEAYNGNFEFQMTYTYIGSTQFGWSFAIQFWIVLF